jgi:FKBP-type peptidyl-prolyl cis-trans isomerase
MHFTTKYLRAVVPHAAGLALALTVTVRAEPTMPETPTDVAAAPADAAKTASGLASKVLKAGTGSKKPVAADTVTVHYSGWTTDGKMFDSSVSRGQPASFPLNGVIKGWTEGLQLMVEGEKRRFWIPANLAYGENPGGGRPGGTLVFDVELLSIKEAPKAPEDVAAAPADAAKTASGLASKVLKKGTGTAHPAATDTVTVHYSGWTTDGNLFDSSVSRGQPASFPLNAVIPGWTEGVQLMVEGEKRRFWIPAALAYGENPGGGRPGGTLVFDVELLKIAK